MLSFSFLDPADTQSAQLIKSCESARVKELQDLLNTHDTWENTSLNLAFEAALSHFLTDLEEGRRLNLSYLDAAKCLLRRGFKALSPTWTNDLYSIEKLTQDRELSDLFVAAQISQELDPQLFKYE